MKGELKFEPISEPWGVYKLQDGNTLKVRPVMVSAVDTGKRDPKGMPVYNLEFQMVSKVMVGE